MANPVDEVPVSVDYTSRDFYSLRSDLVARIKTILPRWSGDSSADFGTALVEAFAYMGDVVNYYIDRVANENYLATATQRQSILNIARNYGYTPAGYRAASVEVQFTNEAASVVVLPAGTELVAEVTVGDATFDVIWTIPTETTVPAESGGTLGTVTTTAYQYEDISRRPENAATGVDDIAGELVAISDGVPEQVYQLNENQIVDNSVQVWVQNGEVFEQWTEVVHVTDYGPYDQIFSVITDADDYVYIQFGDGVSGSIPGKFAVIKASYHYGGGSIGNLATNLITEFYRIPGKTSNEVAALSTTLTVTNTTAGIGGSAPEENSSIKEKAPLALTALNRAVSLKDYSSLALQVSSVGKAKAVADTWTSVTIYAAPQRNSDSVDQFPGYTDNPASGGVLLPEWSSMQSEIQSFLVDKTQIGTSVTVSPPTYVPVTIQLFYSKLDQYSETTLETAITKALLDEFKYSNVDFGAIVHPEEIEATIRAIPGIINARVTAFFRTGGTSERAILIAEPNELFVALSDDLTVTAFSTNSNLQTLTSNVGTLAPTFGPTFYNYSLPVPNGTTSISITPTLQASTAVMKVNGVVKTSGSSTSINTPVGTTTVTIAITAADGLSFSDYVITVTRTA